MNFYVDFEFDGHGGPIISAGLVCDEDDGVYVVTDHVAKDPWVSANVVPLIDSHKCPERRTVKTCQNDVGAILLSYIRLWHGVPPRIIADSPVDIGLLCKCLSTGKDGGWASVELDRIFFEVANVDCYPTSLPEAVQHNAWWDAMALRQKLAETQK